VLARASGRENRLVHISGENFDRNEGEHGRFDCTDQITNRLYCFLRWKFQHNEILYINRIISSFASFHSYLLFYSLLRSKKQEESSTKERTISYSQR
jgi:hypothetical protein